MSQDRQVAQHLFGDASMGKTYIFELLKNKLWWKETFQNPDFSLEGFEREMLKRELDRTLAPQSGQKSLFATTEAEKDALLDHAVKHKRGYYPYLSIASMADFTNPFGAVKTDFNSEAHRNQEKLFPAEQTPVVLGMDAERVRLLAYMWEKEMKKPEVAVAFAVIRQKKFV